MIDLGWLITSEEDWKVVGLLVYSKSWVCLTTCLVWLFDLYLANISWKDDVVVAGPILNGLVDGLVNGFGVWNGLVVVICWGSEVALGWELLANTINGGGGCGKSVCCGVGYWKKDIFNGCWGIVVKTFSGIWELEEDDSYIIDGGGGWNCCWGKG